MTDLIEPHWTLLDMQEAVKRFHAKVLPPGVIPSQQFLKLVEEVGELAVGLHKQRPDLVQDALGDCLYVLLGMANLSGVDLTATFNAVHRSNMTKTGDGSLSPKGVGYTAPAFDAGGDGRTL